MVRHLEACYISPVSVHTVFLGLPWRRSPNPKNTRLPYYLCIARQILFVRGERKRLRRNAVKSEDGRLKTRWKQVLPFKDLLG